MGRADTHAGGNADLQHRAGQRNGAHFEQVVEGKVQAHAEHQQHHPNFGQLACQLNVSDEAGRCRSDHDAGGQVTHQRRQLQAHGEHAEQQTKTEGGGNRGDQGDVVVHAGLPVRWRRA